MQSVTEQAAVGTRIEVRDLVQRYGDQAAGVTALDGVTLDIEPHQMVALMGPSGSGKSTLLNLMGGLDRPTAGSIVVDGLDVATADQRSLVGHRRRTGFVFQRFHLLPALTAADNVLAPVLPLRVDFDKPRRARELLARVGLEGRERATPAQLSGGEQQRVAIARALVNAPRLLLADEPTGNLDSATGRDILALILELRAEHHMTVVVATHDAEVAAVADRVVHLRDGAVSDDIMVNPSAAPRELLARINDLRA
jgi:putative ABC transport system ATP-binding protein